MRFLGRAFLAAGAVAIGLLLFRAAPRHVTLVYGLPPGITVTDLEVDILRGSETLRHAEFHFPRGAPPTVSHPVRLPDGDYLVRLHLSGEGEARSLERTVTVEESGSIVLPLGAAGGVHVDKPPGPGR